MRIKSNQYYGYFEFRDSFDQLPTFFVTLIKPAGSRISEWIGSKNVKLTDMLCVDDVIMRDWNFPVDWSKVHDKP